MNTFEHSPTIDIVTELLSRIEHSNGLDFVGRDDLITLRNLLTIHIDTMTNPHIYTPNPSKPATFTPPRSLSIWDSLYDVKLPTLDDPCAETDFTDNRISAKDYLRMPATAHKYCAKRREEYATLNSYMSWNTDPDGNKYCNIYNLRIQKFPEDYRLWGDVELSDGTVFVLETKQQLMAYILAAYW
jgi:hypothetical protein